VIPGLHNPINDALYGKDPMTPEVSRSIGLIDSAMDKFSLDKDIVVFSGTKASHYADWKVGDIKSIDAFLSTSVSRKKSEVFFKKIKRRSNPPVMLEIYVPKGIKSIYIGDNTNYQDLEDEFLLGHGLKYKVVARIKDVLRLEVVK